MTPDRAVGSLGHLGYLTATTTTTCHLGYLKSPQHPPHGRPCAEKHGHGNGNGTFVNTPPYTGVLTGGKPNRRFNRR